MKYGQESSKEFADFLRESCTAEETYARLLSKLANNASKFGTKGSFSPYWQTVKVLVEKLSNLHLQLVYTWQDLMKDVQRYTDEQHKKHKAMKDSESPTLETVQSIQQTIVAVHKAKETYHVRCLEYEKLRRDSASPKDLEKAEAKFKKATDDYQALVDKYANVRNDFETRMVESCKKFQELEQYHLRQMKDFVDTYSKAWEHQHVLLGQVHEEFRTSNQGLTVDHLIKSFVNAKTTGIEKPGPIEFVEADLSSLPALGSTPDLEKKEIPVLDKPKSGDAGTSGGGCGSSGSGKGSSNAGGGGADVVAAKLDPPPPTITKSSSTSLLDGVLPRNTGWFLSKRRREKKKKKKKDETEKDQDDEANKNSPKVDEDGCQIDEEGYRIRPTNDNQADRDSWDSSSDSDSDPSEHVKKINIEIKPLSSPNGQSTSSNADLEKAVGGLRLSPTVARRTPTCEMKKSTSLSDSINSNGKPSADLLSLGDLFSNLSGSSTTSGTHPAGGGGGGLLFGSPNISASPAANSANNNTPNNASLLAELSELSGGGQSNLSSSSSSSRTRSQTPTTGSGGGFPGPPPARTSRSQLPSIAMARSAGRQSPVPTAAIERTDSVPSLNSMPFTTSSISHGCSRGPSPLTIGMSDTIPLAVAYSERVNSLFKGTDESKCKVKITGEMMVSFPAGIVRVLTENPNPSTLTFCVKNTTNIINILVNKQLLTEDASQGGSESKVYSFDMSVLTDHLRRQTEQNRSASYFNIDILKYEIRCLPGVQSTPLHLVSFWKCEKSHTDFRLDYKYNPAAIATRAPLAAVSVIVPVDGDVTNMLSKPTAVWSEKDKRVTWKLGELSEHSDDVGRGCLRAKFDVTAGPSHPSQAAVQFLCEGHTLSGIDFELVGMGYRISLVKKRFITGKYISESDQAVYV